MNNINVEHIVCEGIFSDRPGSRLVEFIDHRKYIRDEPLTLLHAKPEYVKFQTECPIFDCLTNDQKNRLRQDPRTFFVYDFSFEGMEGERFFEMFYYNCKHHHIPPRKIVYITANLDIDKELDAYVIKNGEDEKINVFPLNSFKEWTQRVHTYHVDSPIDGDTPRRIVKQDAIRNTKLHINGGHYFLSLSRRVRMHRVMMQYLISEDPVLNRHCIMSQDMIPDHMGKLIKSRTGDSFERIAKWMNALPKFADTTDFQTNHSRVINPNLYYQTLFDVVLETFVDHSGMFYTEKTFKPMLFMQPLLILGQQGCNARLADMGFKLYDDWFDYSFDKEPDSFTRTKLLVKELRRITDCLNQLTTRKKIAWRFKNLSVLHHNREFLYNHRNEIRQSIQFCDNLLKLS